MDLPRLSNPCQADFEKMTPAENGRFCDSCCKVVIDFTKKTTAEIFDYLRAHTGTCGRFRPSQVQHIAVPVTQKFSWRLKRFSAALYLVFGALLFSLASCAGGLEDPPRNSLQDSIYNAQINAQQTQLQDSLQQDLISNDSLKSDSANKPH
jgi:hypothetical protein